MTSLYHFISLVPELECKRPRGFPHNLQLRPMKKAIEDGSFQPHVADAVATVLFNYQRSGEVLNKFLNKNQLHLTWERREICLRYFDTIISRIGNRVTCGYWKQYQDGTSAWSLQLVYTISKDGFWTSVGGSSMGAPLELRAEEASIYNVDEMGDTWARDVLLGKSWSENHQGCPADKISTVSFALLEDTDLFETSAIPRTTG